MFAQILTAAYLASRKGEAEGGGGGGGGSVITYQFTIFYHHTLPCDGATGYTRKNQKVNPKDGLVPMLPHTRKELRCNI